MGSNEPENPKPAAAETSVKKPSPAPGYHPLVIALVAACAGVVADRVFPLPVAAWWAGTAAGWAAWLAVWRVRWDRTAAVVILAAVACCAAGWHHCRWCLFDRHDIGRYAEMESRPACVEAIALSAPRRVPAPPRDPMRPIPVGDRCRLTVRLAGIRDGGTWRTASGKARVTVDGHLPGVEPGDRLRVFGGFGTPGPAVNPGQFDFGTYARVERRGGRLFAPYPQCVTVIDGPTFGGPRRWIERLRSAGDRLLWQYVDDRRAGLAAAVLLGVREELGQERSEAFMETGTVHLLAISGLHVGIVAGMLLMVMRLLLVPRGRALLVVAGASILYTLVADARPPAVRAMVLVLAFCAAYFVGRRRPTFNALAAAGLVILALNPADLFRSGTQLSFIAVAGLMWFAPEWFGTETEPDALERLIVESRSWPVRMLRVLGRSVRHLTLVSFLMWALLLPLVMARFHILSLVAVLLNTFLWIPMALALASGLTVLAFGWLLPPVAAAFGWVCDFWLWVMDEGIAAARAVPYGHFWVPGPADWWLVGFYGALGVAAAFPRLRPPKRWMVALIAAWMGVGFVVPVLRQRPGELECTVLSVGHGSAAVMELPDGRTLLYDAGQISSPDAATQTIASCLWARGRMRIDGVVLSHSDVDHYNALPGLLERFSVGAVYVSPVMFEEENSAIEALSEAIRASGVPLRVVAAGDRLEGGPGCRIEVLHPPKRGVLGPDNANSIVLAIEHQGRRILLPGDLETPGLEDVTAEQPWDCDVLLAPHHGSRRSDPPGFAAWCTPEWVVISGGRRWDLSQTITAYRQSGAQVLRTAESGAIRVRIDEEGGLAVEGFLRDRE